MFVYPAAVLAAVMGLAGNYPPVTPRIELLVGYTLCVLMILYPLPFAFSFWASSRALRSNKERLAIRLAFITIAYLGLLFLLLLAS